MVISFAGWFPWRGFRAGKGHAMTPNMELLGSLLHACPVHKDAKLSIHHGRPKGKQKINQQGTGSLHNCGRIAESVDVITLSLSTWLTWYMAGKLSWYPKSWIPSSMGSFQLTLQFGISVIAIYLPKSCIDQSFQPGNSHCSCGWYQSWFFSRCIDQRQSAEVAIQRLNGTMIGQQTVRLSWGRSMTAKQDQPGGWAQPSDPHQWNGAYYGYGQGYDAYGYGATPDPSLYSYGAYAGHGRYPQQADGTQEMVAMAGAVPSLDQKEELYDPLATPNVDKLNSAYLAVHGSAMVGRPLWLKTSALYQQA